MIALDILIIGAIVVLFALIILLKLTNVPAEIYKGRSIYIDHKEKPIEALFSPKYGLVGKPDYILHTKDGLLPLEIKHSKKPIQPYFSHVIQLISYCLLIEETKGAKPKYGFIQYKEGKPFSIPYTVNMKLLLIKTMEEMRKQIDSGQCSNPSARRICKKCREKLIKE
ncbi:Dna2/Cas4 domain-containing protein [Candidatus Woesearchaeota archaeon]|nr:Dna2/Cas4 domain-containing protein [Candidatus Woesearchaeota archaeon]